MHATTTGPTAAQNVIVTEATSGVLLSLSTSQYPALLTAEESRHIAACLLLAAKTVEATNG